MLRRLLIWMMLCALPMQGFASVGMMHCALSQHVHASEPAMHHSAVHFAAGAGNGDASIHHHADSTAASDHHGSGDADTPHQLSKTACCTGAFAIGTMSSGLFLPAGSSLVISHAVNHLPTVFLEDPQRPPRFFLA